MTKEWKDELRYVMWVLMKYRVSIEWRYEEAKKDFGDEDIITKVLLEDYKAIEKAEKICEGWNENDT